MTGLALLLVLLSAVAHATWNFLLKKAHNHEVFSWWLLAATAICLLPLAVVLYLRHPIPATGWIFVAGTGILHVFYFLFLGRAYTRGDLSVVYPVARGMGPALVPVLGVLILNENATWPAIAGIVSVVAGIYIVYWWGKFTQILGDPLEFLKDRSTRYAFLTGLTIAAYSVWDKEGVRHVDPFLYMYLLCLGSGLGLAPYILRAHGKEAVEAEWRKSGKRILAAGFLMFAAYALVLIALTFSRVSYVTPTREVGIVVGALYGIVLLKEPFGTGRIVGSCLIVAGVTLIAVAP